MVTKKVHMQHKLLVFTERTVFCIIKGPKYLRSNMSTHIMFRGFGTKYVYRLTISPRLRIGGFHQAFLHESRIVSMCHKFASYFSVSVSVSVSISSGL